MPVVSAARQIATNISTTRQEEENAAHLTKNEALNRGQSRYFYALTLDRAKNSIDRRFPRCGSTRFTQ
jgi:hypothetical protein